MRLKTGNYTLKAEQGLTLIEIVVVIALLAVITGIVILTGNPFQQIGAARNTTRQLHLEALMNAVRQNVADTGTGSFSCASGPLPTSTKRMAFSGVNTYNIAPCLVPTYIQALPYDPGTTSARYSSNSDYDTAYTIVLNASTSQITIAAPAAELGKTISIIR